MRESTLHTRRQFLRTGVLGGAVAWTVPVFLEKTFFALDAAAADSAIQTMTGKDSPILVVLQLAGGNDGLNTVIPHGQDAYYVARPNIGIAPDKLLKINEEIGLNARLTGLRGLYDSGDLAIIQGVGYPNPNRSHFRSTDIWQTASDSNKFEREGWLGKYFDSCCQGPDPAVGVSIGRQAPMAFTRQDAHRHYAFPNPSSSATSPIAQNDPEATEKIFPRHEQSGRLPRTMPVVPSPQLGGTMAAGDGDTIDYLRRTGLDAQVSSDKVLEITRRVRKIPPTIPATASWPTASSLVSRLIAGGMPTRVYYVSLGGFDTHSGQLASHDRLMTDLNGAITAFVEDLKAQGNFDRVMLMTFSEFGRRVAENNSGGN